MNVKINLPSIKDAGFIAETKTQTASLLAAGKAAANAVHAYVTGKLG
jgi:formiminotetrahydrofolate cyclodeaminase